MTFIRVAVSLEFTIDELKEKYRLFYGLGENVKIKRLDVIAWLSAMLSSDLEKIYLIPEKDLRKVPSSS